jgi:hypothetical protein
MRLLLLPALGVGIWGTALPSARASDLPADRGAIAQAPAQPPPPIQPPAPAPAIAPAAPAPTAAPAAPAPTAAPVPVATPPAQLQETIAKIDAAASQRDLKGVMQFYSSDFKNSDGLNRQTLEQSLAKLWQDYGTLNYRTQINTWKPTSNGFVAETTTTITGSRTADGRNLALKSTFKVQQQFVDNKIVSQDILAERNQLTTGEAPPTVEFKLPEQIAVGQTFALDAIVQEPLDDSILLGSAVQEPITPEAYVKSPPLELELLNSGGIFKTGTAPSQPSNQWVSIALIRDTGMTLITQRLRVVQK